ncbi:MAG: hypothetical protein ABI401_13635 [Candidatus Dormibacter sp.]
MTGRPGDACPYPKPFGPEFNDCPSYQTRHALVLDASDQPLRTIWSCRHMGTKRVPGQKGHYYGACQLGDAAGRAAWVQRIGADRIRGIQRLRTEVMPIAQAYVDRMAVLKGQQLEAAREGADTEAVREQMRAAGQLYLDDLDACLKQVEPLLQEAQMPREGVIQLARQWVDEFLGETWARSQGDQHLPDDLLAALPDSVRVFYAPR